MDDTNKPKLNPEQDSGTYDAEPQTNTGYVSANPVSDSPDPTLISPDENPVTAPTTTPAIDPVPTPVATNPVVPTAQVASNTAPSPFTTPEPTYQTGAFGTTPVETMPIPPKKSKKGLLIGGIIAIVAVLLLGGSALAYNVWYQNPDKVITDAIINASKAQSVVFNGAFDVTGEQKVKVVFDGGAIDSSGFVNAKVTFDTSGKTVTIDGSVLVDKDYNLYIKIKDAKALITSALGEYATTFDTIIAKVDNKWVKITTDDLSDLNKQTKETKNCIDETYTKFKDDKAAINEVTEVFKANRFIIVSKQLPSQNGSLGYEISTDQAKGEAFAKAVLDTKIYKQLHECDAESFPGEYTAPAKSDDTSPEPTIQLWVSRFGHELTKLTIDQDDDGTKAHLDIETVFNTQVPVDAPTEFITVDELKKDIEKLFTSQTSSSYDY